MRDAGFTSLQWCRLQPEGKAQAFLSPNSRAAMTPSLTNKCMHPCCAHDNDTRLHRIVGQIRFHFIKLE